jgi:hypothetical protein
MRKEGQIYGSERLVNGVRAPLTYLSGFDAKPVTCWIGKKHVRKDRVAFDLSAGVPFLVPLLV